MDGSQKETPQTPPIHVHMPFQPHQSLYKDLTVPLTFHFSPISPYQSLQPLAITHPDHNPFKPSGIFLAITYNIPPQPEPQNKPQTVPFPTKKDKEPLYQPPDPTVGASSRPPDMNMLAIDPDPPNPISSFLKTLTLADSREPFLLPVIEDSELDLSNLGLEEVFMTNTEPKVEEEDGVLRPKQPPPPPPIFPPPPIIPD
ncbi:proline-rich extensin-like protein EPR1 [Quercus suber]|uniref:proline-rich extensin-like protein EPR1 n=1 Tax=Quercus suber TaxID=58331 RepID=UPI0032DF577D